MGINWEPCSNAEFAPPDRDPVVVETERRVEAQSTQIARSLNIDNASLRLQASVYYVAKAEGEWAEILIANSPF